MTCLDHLSRSERGRGVKRMVKAGESPALRAWPQKRRSAVNDSDEDHEPTSGRGCATRPSLDHGRQIRDIPGGSAVGGSVRFPARSYNSLRRYR